MPRFVIRGGSKIEGEIRVSGAKNAALKVFPVSILTDETIRVAPVPDIEDCACAKEVLLAIGGKVSEGEKGALELQSRAPLRTVKLPEKLVSKFRASIMFVGPILARFHEVEFPHPGGCVIGAAERPIDMFLDGFARLGAKTTVRNGYYRITAKKLKGNTIFFPKVTVTGTESMMTTAVLAEGVTVLKNAAMEPEIPALAEFLNRLGARIKGAGTPTITIDGVKKLGGGEYAVIPDRIEAGTFAVLAAASQSGEVIIRNVIPGHLEALWAMFDRTGVNYRLEKHAVIVRPSRRLSAADVVTHEYPGFATDLQPPYTVLMTQARGISLIHETIFDRRLLFTDILSQMGAKIIMADPHRIVVNGPSRLEGKKIISPDLRAGIALVIASLIAEGNSEIENIYQIDRGYERLDERLRGIGADIARVDGE